jgi:FtsH-binding integral membrane protein
MKMVIGEDMQMQRSGLMFVLGFLSLGGGLFLIGQAVSVSTNFGGFGVWGVRVPSGLLVIPLLIGIGMLFYNHKGNAWKIVTSLGVLFILLAVIMSVRISVARVSLFNFVLMFGLTAAMVFMSALLRKGKAPDLKGGI